MVSPNPATQTPAVFLFGEDPSGLLQCAEALVDFFPAARLTLPLNLSEAFTVIGKQSFDLAIVCSPLELRLDLLHAFQPGQRVLSLGPAPADAIPGLALDFHFVPPEATPRQWATEAAALLGRKSPTWNTAWSEALRLIASEALTVRVSVKGPGGLEGEVHFAGGKATVASVRDASGRRFRAEDLLYLPDIVFETHVTETAPRRAGQFLQPLSTRDLPKVETTIFRQTAARAVERANRRLTISVVEDDHRLRDTLRQILEEDPDFSVLDTFATAEEALDGLMARPPMIALFDLNLPGLSGQQLIARLAGHLVGTSFLAVTSQTDDQNMAEFLRQGGVGYILKSDLANDLPDYIRTVAEGGTTLSPGVARRLLRFFSQPHPFANPALSTLGSREKELLEALASGSRLQHIAQEHGQTPLELGRRLRVVCRRFAATARAQALATALSPRSE